MKQILRIACAGIGIMVGSCSDTAVDGIKTVVSRTLKSTAVWRANFGVMHQTIRYSPVQTVRVDNIQVLLTNRDSSQPVSGGMVRLNGAELTARYSRKGGVTYQNINLNGNGPNIVPVAFDGSYHLFQVEGGAGFPPLVDSVRSFPHTVFITSPVLGANISKSAGLTVTWDGTASTNAHVMITGKGPKGFGRTVHRTNILHIPASELAGLEPGEITISVSSSSYKGDDSGGIERLMSITYMDALIAQLVP